MPTRDLKTNSSRIWNRLEKLPDVASRELIQNYDRALKDVRAEITRLYELYMPDGELTKAQMTQFLRQSNIEQEIVRIMSPILEQNKDLLKEVSQVSFDQSYYGHAWAVDQAAGVSLQWGLLSDNAVRAAVGLSDDAASLTGLMSEREVKKHAKLLDDAFNAYSKDTRKWIGREVTQGVIKGDSVQKVAKRLRDKGIAKSYNSAMRIARTETLRASSLGSQIAYAEAEDNGVKVRQIWDATLDMRTRPEHADLDGQVMQDGVFQTAVGPVPGPKRSGDPSFDINCRCRVVAETEGFTPSVRRTREDGLIPYKTFRQWAQEKGRSANEYGQKYDFLNG